MISGIPDLVLKDSELNDFQIWDFKTGKINEKKLSPYWFQLYCYAYSQFVLGKIKKGNQIDSGAERVIVHKTKLPNSKTDIYVEQDLNTGNVTYPFNFESEDIFKITDKYIKNEKIINNCDTYREDLTTEFDDVNLVKDFLFKFNDFVALEEHRNWTDRNNIRYTPATFMNSNEYPSKYDYDDLLFLIIANF